MGPADDRLTVEALRLELADLAAADGLRQSEERSTQGLARNERLKPATTGLDVAGELSADQYDEGAGDALRAATLPRLAGPRQRCPVGLRGIACGKDERRRGIERTLGAQPLDGTGQRELCSTEALDEISATRDPERLELGQRVVERREAARDTFGEDELARQDPVSLEQQLSERTAARDWVAGAIAEERRCERPAALERSACLRTRGAVRGGEAPA
jgi:hypothetical protein